LDVYFPTFEPEERSPGCAMAFLVAAILLALPIPVVAVVSLSSDSPLTPTLWVAYAVVIAITVVMVLYAIAGVRTSRLPVPVIEPSVLKVNDDVLRIERVGKDRGTDVSWERAEIADIRLCVAAPDRVFLGIPAMLGHALSKSNNMIRVSVLLPSGDVDDVMIATPGQYWVGELEEKLRDYLGLIASDPAPGGQGQ
jgi:hypothetical protein